MSGVALRPAAGEATRERLGVELALFAALGAFAVIQWSRLFEAPPVGKFAVTLAIACAGGLAIALAGRRLPRHSLRVAVALLLALATTVLGLLAVGLPARLLAPAHWGELASNLGEGLKGVESTPLPYGGEQTWLRLTLLFGPPLGLGIAAALAFWPSRSRSRSRVLALIALIALYAVAVTLDSPGAELLVGVPLLLLAVAWLWLPELEPGRGVSVLAYSTAAATLALPLAVRLDTGTPWFAYEDWDLFGSERTVGFDWNHTYGPLEWPQQGTELLEVSSAQPLYWKTSVLDRFDGYTWHRAEPGQPDNALVAGAVPPTAAELAARHPEWRLRSEFEVSALRSDFVVGAGTPLAVEGMDRVLPTSDGTVLSLGEPLERGDSYSVVSYAPQPSPRRMRAAPQTYTRAQLDGATVIDLPAEVPAVGPAGAGPEAGLEVPAWGRPSGLAGARMLDSPYAGVYRLATRLTAGEPTVYDAVQAVERYLSDGRYDYSTEIGPHAYPLAAFLFDDLEGYCQQFSGAMALILRMSGIPSRVVSGFAPGSFDPNDEVYEVRDTDAHSWVEVYFRGIGWVTFDPTPAAAPAAAQTLELGGPLILRRDGTASIPSPETSQGSNEAIAGGVQAAGQESGGGLNPALLALLAALTGGGALAAVQLARGRRRLRSADGPELQARELGEALARFEFKLPGSVTLLEIERRFGRGRRAPIGRYAAALRGHRYAAAGAGPPGAAARRGLRRVLAGGGLRQRLRAWRAIPLGGPRG